MTENDPGDSENKYEKTLDITQFAGDTVYIAFRHHDLTDNSSLEIDDVSVSSNANMFVKKDKFDSFNHFIDPNNNLVLKAKTNIKSIRLYSILGQQVIYKPLYSTEAPEQF